MGDYNIIDDETLIKELERKLHLKNIQIQRLLNITQAINSNVKAQGLYDMYRNFLNFEMNVPRVILYIKKGHKYIWEATISTGIDNKAVLITDFDIATYLKENDKPARINFSEHELLCDFNVAIPVWHKENPIALAFIGGLAEDVEFYNSVQLITHVTSLIAVALENKRLFKLQLEQDALHREMKLACDMQKMLVPNELPQRPQYELASVYMPHYEVGGDYYDCIEFENWVTFCVADISGKGLAAAILMASFQANLHTLIDRCESLQDFVRDLNDSVLRITKGEKYVTFFFAEYNTKNQILRYINCGHIPPIILCNGEIRTLEKGSTFLGMFPELPNLELGEVHIKETSTILAFTDGLTDIRNKDGDFFNENILYEFVIDYSDYSAKQLNDALMEYIDQFRGKLGYPDDFTLLTCKIKIDTE